MNSMIVDRDLFHNCVDYVYDNLDKGLEQLQEEAKDDDKFVELMELIRRLKMEELFEGLDREHIILGVYVLSKYENIVNRMNR